MDKFTLLDPDPQPWYQPICSVGIIKLCLSGPRLLTRPLPLLVAGQSAAITLSQEQAAVLLANSFLSTFPRRNKRGGEYANYPDINMNRMLRWRLDLHC